ncbi:MAG: transglycosylase domain-containing protein [Acidimicrobiales bacterium]
MRAVQLLARFLISVLVAGLGLAVAVLVLVPQVRDFFTAGVAGPDKQVDLAPLATRSVVYAKDGSVLTTFHAEENRVLFTLDKVPEHVVKAVLAAEDERFWDHGPIDFRSLARALVENIQSGDILQGGSTITQQLVKTALLTPDQDLNRKVQEAALAVRLERQMTKPEILERYLNTVYFGNGQYGLEAAGRLYFGHGVSELTMGEGILLASLIRNPVGGDPWVFPDEAFARRDLVIDRMLSLGNVSAEDAEQLKGEPLPTPPAERPAQGSDYFVEHVKQLLLADERLGATAQDRIRAVFKGGLHIHTTLDPGLQRTAEEKVAAIVPDTGGEFGAALVSIDPTTGAVRALVGGSGFDSVKFNLATDPPGRQTGSSFKTFTLAAALEAGYLPNDIISGVYPCRIDDPESEAKIWEPKNVEGGAGGVMTLTDATVSSVNCAYARLIKLVGPAKVVDVAKRMGVMEDLSPPLLSLTLGSKDVTPLSMASAYATLAADGERRAPVFVDRVEDSAGKVVFKNEPKPERAISVQNARTINSVLSQVVTRGTGGAAAIPGWANAQGGKTGSTDNNWNAWYVGYTKDLSTAVWMGSPRGGQKPMTNVGGVTVYGGTYPAMIWGAYMRTVEAGKTPARFPAPENLTARQPRTLLLANEAPADVRQNDSSQSNNSDQNGGGNQGGQAGPTTSVNRAVPTTVFDPFGTVPDDDDTPRTTRTSRPPRPRDITTIPP